MGKSFDSYRGQVSTTAGDQGEDPIDGEDAAADVLPVPSPVEMEGRGPDPGMTDDQRAAALLAGEDDRRPPAVDAVRLLKSEPTPPRRFWRRRANRRRRTADLAAQEAARVLVARITRPFSGGRTIAVASTKGGVGKTTCTVLLGHTLASLRDDRVVALDANPDAGSLGYRVPRESTANAVDLLDLVGTIRDYYDLRHFTSQASSRLEVIAAADDPRDTRGISQSDTDEVLAKLQANYTVVLADCGTGLLDGAATAILDAATQLVIVTAPRIDSVHSVTYMLRWLVESGHAKAAQRAVVAVNGVHPEGGVDVDALVAHFAPLVRSVVQIPWDPDLARGGTTDLGQLQPATRHALAHLAAAVADGF